ncbi:MAG TPA: hypothetical protein VMV89_10580 [Candidatus Paceibacterota bacterium]|nr:hypothetical protein [Candidatus Paceibacterota bacterium]
MKLNWNFALFALLAATALSAAGCSGINASQSVSPASFFLPGLLRADPPQTNAPDLLSENSSDLVLIR